MNNHITKWAEDESIIIMKGFNIELWSLLGEFYERIVFLCKSVEPVYSSKGL